MPTLVEEIIYKADAGETVALKYYGGRDAKEVETKTIATGCGGSQGRWICVSHGEIFGNNFEKDAHIDDHRRAGTPITLAWLCFEHGPEVP